MASPPLPLPIPPNTASARARNTIQCDRLRSRLHNEYDDWLASFRQQSPTASASLTRSTGPSFWSNASLPLRLATEPQAARLEAPRQIADDAPNYQGYGLLDPSRQEIRVLDLEADLTCTLRHVDLSASPVYHALSYCWGPPGSTRTLTIKAVNTGETEVVLIRKTLAKFLKSLYRQYGALTVWLDVICINKRSFAEQDAQVAMMGDIYRCTKSVYAWIGPWDPDIEYAFSFASETSPDQRRYGSELKKVGFGLDIMFYRSYWTRYVPKRVLVARLTDQT